MAHGPVFSVTLSWHLSGSSQCPRLKEKFSLKQLDPDGLLSIYGLAG